MPKLGMAGGIWWADVSTAGPYEPHTPELQFCFLAAAWRRPPSLGRCIERHKAQLRRAAQSRGESISAGLTSSPGVESAHEPMSKRALVLPLFRGSPHEARCWQQD